MGTYNVSLLIIQISKNLSWLKEYGFLLTIIIGLLIFVILFILMEKRKVAEKLKEQTELCNYLVTHDTTTDLYNRKYVLEHLKHNLLIADRSTTALYVVQLSNLKVVNDTYGHEVGDEVMQHIADILSGEFTQKNECVGISSTEFLISDSTSNSKEVIIKRGKKIMDLLSRSIRIGYMEIEMKVNIGISLMPEHTVDVSELLKKANIALMESTREGPNSMKLFAITLYKDTLKRITLEKELRRAIDLNEFVLFYQPKINIKSMTVDGCEALIRWNHPDGKLVYPDTFIPLAEEMGLIEEIGKWVMNESTNQLKKWADIGRNIRISINVSGKEFDDEFIKRLDKMIKNKRINPNLIEVEITETSALKDIGHSKQLVRTLHRLGISVSLDDFGTGYSSMLYIKKLKASKLKIDKSFIDNLENYEQKVVVDSMIQLGKKLDYIINIEGVETKEQLKTLKYLGVDEVQGWLFSKALPADDFIDFVEDFNGYVFEDYKEAN